MNTNKNKIEKLFPSVYITLISILLGFAVEDVVSRLRELATIDIFTLFSAAAILSTVIAAWIGYSFVSMTQERLPRILDAVHVFFLAFCFYVMNSTLGMEIWWFFLAVFVYEIAALFATIYNANILLKSLPTSYDWRIFQGGILIIGTSLVVYPVGAWMSLRGVLPPGVEIALVAYLVFVNVLWVYFFYHGWTKLVNEEA